MKKNNLFLLSVSWVAGQSPGTSRDTNYKFPTLHFEPDLDLEDFSGKVSTIVVEDGVVINGEFNAKTKLECTRCLEAFPYQLDISFSEMYVFSHAKIDDDIETRPFPPDGYIHLGPLFREYALLNIPIKHICSSDCKGLCLYCGENLNKGDCGHEQETIDPRMEVLKQLLDK